MIRGKDEARDAEDPPPEPQWTVLARHPDFRRLFTGNSISLLGSSVTAVALPLTAVLYLGASATEMGLLGALGLLPHLVLGLPAGVLLADMAGQASTAGANG